MAALKSQLRMVVALAFASLVFSAAAAELPPLPAGLTAPSKPVHVPDFKLTQAAGGTARADEFHGKVLIARFWASW